MNVEKLKNLYAACPDKYGAAREMNTTYQTLYNIIYKGSDFKVDLLQRVAAYFKVSVGYFFDETTDDNSCREELEHLRKENTRLREELRMKADPEQPKKESEVYRLWMEHMKLSEQQNRISEQMRELYQKQKIDLK